MVLRGEGKVFSAGADLEWMRRMAGAGREENLRDAEAMDAWARHYREFIRQYGNHSVPIWGVTAQNEPLTQTGLWGSNFFTQVGQTLASHCSTLQQPPPWP